MKHIKDVITTNTSFLIWYFSADTVADGFIQLLNDEDKVGEAMTVSVHDGIGYHKFPEELQLWQII
jgi:hypothetical protein